jgi:type II secretory pathway pseudopilin PulG
LIEIMIAIAILIIGSAIFLGTLRSIQPSLRLEGALQDLATDIRFAQQETVTEQVEYGVIFLRDANSYRVVRYNEGEECILEKNLSSGIEFYQIIGFTEDTVVFNPYGAVRKSGSVSLINEKGDTVLIEIRPSGFVKIQK